MWGESERAITLDTSDPLTAILLQITGPAHIPWQDPRWQELLHGYNVWVHLEQLSETDFGGPDAARSSIVSQACHSLLQYAPRTSNLAALTIHVTRMLREVLPTTGGGDEIGSCDDGGSGVIPDDVGAVELFSNRIALVGKARAVAGAMNLLRILCHAVIVESCKMVQPRGSNRGDDYLEQVFLYQSRDSTRQVDTATDLISAVCQFLVSPNLFSNDTANVPELYDAATLALQLLLVLLSTQLYQPVISSFQRQQHQPNGYGYAHFFWDRLWLKAREKSASGSSVPLYRNSWTPRSLIMAFLMWHIERPKAPPKSIAHYLAGLAQSVVEAAVGRGEKKSADGMYENHLIVMASAPLPTTGTAEDGTKWVGYNPVITRPSSSSSIILDATKGVLVLSSTIIFLPFRLVSLALALWGLGHGREKVFDKSVKGYLASQLNTNKAGKTTKDALWLSDSIVADLSTSLLLLLVNSHRSGNDVNSNPFRHVLESLSDNRWESDASALPDLPDFVGQASHVDADEEDEREPLMLPNASKIRDPPTSTIVTTSCSVNFESLFESFGLVTHTELGALLLYTVLQASKSFAEAIAVRSDLDALILPMLRTLYFASSSKYFIGPESTTNAAGKDDNKHGRISLRSCPFRSPSQLYVIIILLLIFSQDASFGADAFRRIRIPVVPFYKERNLKEISLGSILILSLLRSLTFNLNRLFDPFLLSNCCAILMNLSNSVVDIHDYAAMRLVSITVSTCKKFTMMIQSDSGASQENPTSPESMYCEVSRTLLRVLRQCLASRAIEGNLNLVYALVYHHTDLKRVLAMDKSPFRAGETRLIQAVAATGADIVEKNSARASSMALKVLADNIEKINEASLAMENHKQKNPNDSGKGEDFTFTYEEEADPEMFFVPYIWEVIVCAVTSGSIGWMKRSIQAFPLLDEESFLDDLYTHSHDLPEVVAQGFAKDVSDIV